MYMPVTLILGGDETSAKPIAKRFYSSGSAVVLAGGDSATLADTHKDLYDSGWIKPILHPRRDSESGAWSAEQAMEEFLGVSRIISLASCEVVANDSKAKGLPPEVGGVLSDILDEACAAASRAESGCPIVVVVSIPQDCRGDETGFRQKVRDRLRDERKRRRLELVARNCELHLLVWDSSYGLSDLEDLTRLVFGLCSAGKALVT